VRTLRRVPGGAFGVILLSLLGAALAGSCAGRRPLPGPPVPAAAPDDIAWTLFLIGDAGAPTPRDPVLLTLIDSAARAPERSTIVFLGDNIYPAGLPDSTDLLWPIAAARLDRQIEVMRRSRVRGFFIPGNHDWAQHGPDGFQAVIRQAEFIRARSEGLAELLPPNGCPGPEIRDIGTELRLVFLDTHWWLHDWVKPEHPTSSCGADRPEEIVAALADAMRGGGERRVIVAGHHPLVSGGKHGGHFGLTDHLFPLRAVHPALWLPLPVIGSMYPLLRTSGASPQDVSNVRNRRMREAIDSGMAAAPPLAYAAGHEHNLQVLEGVTSRWLLISGAGYFGHDDLAVWLDRTRFAAKASGFMRVDLLRSGRTRLGVIGLDRTGAVSELFSTWLE